MLMVNVEGVNAVRLLEGQPARGENDDAQDSPASPKSAQRERGNAPLRLAHANAREGACREPRIRLGQGRNAQQPIEKIGACVVIEWTLHTINNTVGMVKLRGALVLAAGSGPRVR